MESREIKYQDWLQEWLKMKKGTVKESIWANYSVAIVNHIIPALGACTIDEITEEKLQQTLCDWLQNGRLDRTGGLSRKATKDLMNIVKSSLKAARKKYKLQQEIVELDYPAAEGKQVKVFTAEQQERLLSSIMTEYNRKTMGIFLCLYTGLRIGEVCALRWTDIDLQGKVLKVRKTVQRIYSKDLSGKSNTYVIVTTPKTKNAVRDIPLSDFLISFLQKLVPDEQETYFLTGTASCIEPRVYRKYYARFLQKHGLPYLCFHSLRHTFATRCIEDGADYKTVSALLGHSSVNLTLNLYVHPQMELKRKCVGNLPTFNFNCEDLEFGA